MAVSAIPRWLIMSVTTIVFPTYNERENLPKIVAAVFAQPIDNLRILVVDDNSPDGTGAVADELASQYAGRLKVLHRAKKGGLGTAYVNGFRCALDDGADFVGQMDADFSHPPEKLVELQAALKDCDMALGSRYVTGGMLDTAWPLWRKGLSAFGNFYARAILGLAPRDVTGGFRLWRAAALRAIPWERVRSNGYAFQIETLYIASRLGFRMREIPIYFSERHAGVSKMSLQIQLEAAIQVWRIRFAFRDLQAVPQPVDA